MWRFNHARRCATPRCAAAGINPRSACRSFSLPADRCFALRGGFPGFLLPTCRDLGGILAAGAESCVELLRRDLSSIEEARPLPILASKLHQLIELCEQLRVRPLEIEARLALLA